MFGFGFILFACSSWMSFYTSRDVFHIPFASAWDARSCSFSLRFSVGCTFMFMYPSPPRGMHDHMHVGSLRFSVGCTVFLPFASAWDAHSCSALGCLLRWHGSRVPVFPGFPGLGFWVFSWWFSLLSVLLRPPQLGFMSALSHLQSFPCSSQISSAYPSPSPA